MPQALQKIFGITPLLATVAFLPLTVVQFISSLFVAKLTFKKIKFIFVYILYNSYLSAALCK